MIDIMKEKWPYQVIFPAKKIRVNPNTIEFEYAEEIIKWLKDNNVNYRIFGPGPLRIGFVDSNHALMFKLKWA